MKPATPLPWRDATFKDGQGRVGTPYGMFAVPHAHDAAYIAHAANAYPKLVEALRDADYRERMSKRIPDDVTTNNSALLHELGEKA